MMMNLKGVIPRSTRHPVFSSGFLLEFIPYSDTEQE
jgi:hypothetical protein